MKKLLFFLIIALLISSCRFFQPESKQTLVVCISFDDADATVYEYAFPILEQYGYRATVFVNSGTVGIPGIVTWKQLENLKQNYHWEIGGHTYNHVDLTSLTVEQAENEISMDLDSLSAHGLAPVTFALPFGHSPCEYYDTILKYYKNIRTINNITMVNPINRSILGSFANSSLNADERLIDRVLQGMLEKENLIILRFHMINPNLEGQSNNCTPATFLKFVQKLHSLDVIVLPINEAVDYLSD